MGFNGNKNVKSVCGVIKTFYLWICSNGNRKINSSAQTHSHFVFQIDICLNNRYMYIVYIINKSSFFFHVKTPICQIQSQSQFHDSWTQNTFDFFRFNPASFFFFFVRRPSLVKLVFRSEWGSMPVPLKPLRSFKAEIDPPTVDFLVGKLLDLFVAFGYLNELNDVDAHDADDDWAASWTENGPTLLMTLRRCEFHSELVDSTFIIFISLTSFSAPSSCSIFLFELLDSLSAELYEQHGSNAADAILIFVSTAPVASVATVSSSPTFVGSLFDGMPSSLLRFGSSSFASVWLIVANFLSAITLSRFVGMGGTDAFTGEKEIIYKYMNRKWIELL